MFKNYTSKIENTHNASPSTTLLAEKSPNYFFAVFLEPFGEQIRKK